MHVVQFGSSDYSGSRQEAAESYDAISYVWGPPQDSRLIYCNNEPVQIPRNLRNALKLIWRKQPKLRIWADRLCINQDDIEEKGSQVEIMGLIFESARCVHIWIGDPVGNTKWTLRYIRRCTEEKLVLENLTTNEHTPLLAPQRLLPRRLLRLSNSSNVLQDQADRSQFGDLPHWLRFFILYISKGLVNLPMPNWLSYYLASVRTRVAVQFGSSARSAIIQAGLQDLAGRPWFSRAWTLQEILLAKHAVLRCGPYELEWSVWVQGLGKLLEEGIIDPSTQFLLKEALVDMNLDLQTLSQLLVKSWGRMATDPRDKLYSLLALVRDRDKIGYLLPDYKLDNRKTYIAAARACIIDDGDLGILGGAGLKRDPYPPSEAGHAPTTSPTYKIGNLLPSWVPNWQDPISRPRGFNLNHLARAWVSQNRGNTLGQRWDDLSDYLVLHGIGIGRFRLPTAVTSVRRRMLLLDRLPPCSIPKPATAVGEGCKWHGGAALIVPYPVDVEISAVFRAAGRHDLQKCPCFRFSSQSPGSGDADIQLKLRAQIFPESIQPGDWLCAMKGAQRLHVLRPLPATVSAPVEADRAAHRRWIGVEASPACEQKFVLIGEMHPTANDGDAIVLEHFFELLKAVQGAPASGVWIGAVRSKPLTTWRTWRRTGFLVYWHFASKASSFFAKGSASAQS